MPLKNETIHALRSMAQSYGVTDIFQKQHHELVQLIEQKQQGMVPQQPIVIPQPVYDARLMDTPPSRRSNRDEMMAALAEHVSKGLHVSFPNDEEWHMQLGRKEDTGTVRQPLRNILRCANEMMK